jgi:hypothetical protein
MCGLTGVLGHANGQGLTQVVEAMTDTLLHRGPDDGGVSVMASTTWVNPWPFACPNTPVKPHIHYLPLAT